MENIVESIRVISQRIGETSDPEELSELYMHRGIGLNCLQKRRQALEDFDLSIGLNPKNVIARKNRGEIFSSVGSWTNNEKIDTYELLEFALEDFNYVLLRIEDDAEIYCGRAEVRQLLGDYGGAVDDFSKALNLGVSKLSMRKSAFMRRGMSYKSLGRYDKANADYQEMANLCQEIGDDDGYKLACMFSKNAHTGSKSRDTEAKNLSSSQEKNKERFSYCLESPCSHVCSNFSGDNDIVYELLRKAAKVSEVGMSVSMELLSQALEIDPDCSGTYFLMGLNLMNIENYPIAIRAFTQALELNQNDSDLWGYLGNCLLSTDEVSKARNALLEAIRINPRNQYAYDILGDVFLKHNNRRDGILAYQAAIELDPKNVTIRNKRAQTLSHYKYHLSHAIEAFEESIAIDPDCPKTYFNMAMLFSARGYKSKAAGLYQKAITLYQQQGDYESARVIVNAVEKHDLAI